MKLNTSTFFSRGWYLAILSSSIVAVTSTSASASTLISTPTGIWKVVYEGFWDNPEVGGGGSVLGSFFVPPSELNAALSDGFVTQTEVTDWRFEWTGNDKLPAFTIRRGFGDASEQFTRFRFPVSVSAFPLEFSAIGGDPSRQPSGMARAGDEVALTITKEIVFQIDEPNTPFGGPSVYSYPPNLGLSGSFSSGPLTRAFSQPVLRSAPEPTSAVGILALGILGAGSALKRKQNQQKSAISVTDKV